MGQGNSDIIFFLEQHEQEIINCCRKGMSNNEVRELLKTKLIGMLQILPTGNSKPI